MIVTYITQLCQCTAPVFQGRAQRENQRYDNDGRQGRGEGADCLIGMIGNCAVSDRRKSAGADDARVKQRKSTWRSSAADATTVLGRGVGSQVALFPTAKTLPTS
jgi:hypothetical protein